MTMVVIATFLNEMVPRALMKSEIKFMTRTNYAQGTRVYIGSVRFYLIKSSIDMKFKNISVLDFFVQI